MDKRPKKQLNSDFPIIYETKTREEVALLTLEYLDKADRRQRAEEEEADETDG